ERVLDLAFDARIEDRRARVRIERRDDDKMLCAARFGRLGEGDDIIMIDAAKSVAAPGDFDGGPERADRDVRRLALGDDAAQLLLEALEIDRTLAKADAIEASGSPDDGAQEPGSLFFNEGTRGAASNK